VISRSWLTILRLPSSSSRTARLVRVSVFATSMISLIASPASADIRACREMKPPQTEAEAHGRAGFAFDGVVVEGRTVQDQTGGRNVLVSPLTFRVIRSLKGRVLDYGERTSSGAILIEVWDAEYSLRNLKEKVVRQRGPDARIPNELASVRGAKWRIYALNQAGNWTATTCLGSHPLGTPNSQRGSGLPRPWVLFLVGLAGIGAVAFLWLRTLRFMRVQKRGL
jgi:hypothetical protein